MLPRADLNNTRPLVPVDAPAPVASSTDARQEVYHRLSQIAIGQHVQADVISQLEDGTFLVKVADTTARMALPVGTRVGDSLAMVFVAKEPRPTFLLTQEGSATASLSTAARLIDQLLQTADQDGAPTVIAAKTPLLASAAGLDPKQVATALHDSLEFSGLFYESHVKEWVGGGRSTAELQREPQAQIGAALRESGAAAQQPAPASAELARLAASMRELGDGVHALMDLIRDAQQQSGKLETVDADVIARSQAALPPLDADAARLINLQLRTLEQQNVRWQGELWPGQPFEWEVGEDTRDGNGKGAQQSSWTSVVRFRLPTLGEVSATLRLSGDRVQVQVSTPSAEVASSLRAHTGSLADALEAAGSPLDSLLVKNDETA